MSFDIIRNLFITLCFVIIFFMSASSLYIQRSNYSNTIATIENVSCVLIPNTNLYSCDLTINYAINNNKVSNQLIINSEQPYKKGDNVNIDYDINNYLNVSIKTEYKRIALISCVSAVVFLIVFISLYNQIRHEIIQKINNILSYTSFLS